MILHLRRRNNFVFYSVLFLFVWVGIKNFLYTRVTDNISLLNIDKYGVRYFQIFFKLLTVLTLF